MPINIYHARSLVNLNYAKMSNILLECQPTDALVDRKALLIDFGFGGWLTRLQVQDAPGTLFYWSPEQVRGQIPTQTMDRWSLAVVLYQMLTGSLPFYHPDDPTETLRRICHEPAPSPTSLNRDLPEAIDEFLKKALAKEEQGRFGSSEEMLEALRQSISADH